MILYVLKRLLQSIVTILLVVTIVFLLLRLLPTDYYFTEDELMKLTEEQKHDRLEAAGFLDPPLTQLGRFFKQLFTEFDLGTSRRIQANQPRGYGNWQQVWSFHAPGIDISGHIPSHRCLFWRAAGTL